MPYAEATTVPVTRTISEVQAQVRKVGGTHWSYTEQDDHDPPVSAVSFRLQGYQLRFTVRHPDDDDVATTPAGRNRYGEQLDRALDRELMRRWRSLGLLIKAQLTAISEGTVSVDQAMLAHIVDPASDTTVGEWTAPHVRRLQAGRALPQLPAAVRITEER